MTIYELMKNYADWNKTPRIDSLAYPELGRSLSLFHACLLESGLENDKAKENPKITAQASKIGRSHLSRFVVGFLPYNSVDSQTEANAILFEVYSFFDWLKTRDIRHGLENIDFRAFLKELSSAQERCLKLSNSLDEESGRTLKDTPPIVETINDFFQVTKIERGFVYLQGHNEREPIRLKFPSGIMEMIRVNDNLDLVLGDTSHKWVLLESGQVFP
jgi:hypothetical protein